VATIYKECTIDNRVEAVWDALRDFAAVQRRVAPGFLTDCRMEGEGEDATRVLTFSNGLVARERFVGLDDAARRLCYTVEGGKAAHHNASAQVFAEGEGRTRFVWITDVLPHAHAPYIGAMMDEGMEAMKKALAA
jgi:carbon monoxide dehydrogenase subunit G